MSRSSRHTRVVRALPSPPRLSGPVVLLIGCRPALCLMLTPTWAPGRAPGSGIGGSRRPKGCTPFKRSGQESGVRQAPVDCQGGHPPARKPACRLPRRPPTGQAHSSPALATASAWGPPCLAAWWREDCTFHAGPGAAPACATCSRESPDEHGVPNPLVTCTGGSQPVWRRLDGHWAEQVLVGTKCGETGGSAGPRSSRGREPPAEGFWGARHETSLRWSPGGLGPAERSPIVLTMARHWTSCYGNVPSLGPQI